MVKARFFLTDLKKRSLDNDGGLVQDVWYIIFQNLEPSFVNSILRTCKLFNALASSDKVFTPLLFQFYPSVQPQATTSSYHLFKPLYVAETRTLSPPTRTLRDLCFYQDYQQIKYFIEKFQFEPDMLFEKDVNEQTVLAHVNRLQRQDLRDLLFQAIHAWFVTQAKNKAWSFPIGILLGYYYTDNMPFEFVTAKYFILMDFAVALNQLEFIKAHAKHFTRTPPRSLSTNIKCVDFFNSACLFGHLDIIKYMLVTGYQFFDRFATAVENPLSYAVKGNQAEVVEFFILTHRRLLTDTMANGAAVLAVNDHRLAILELMLDFHKTNFPLLVRLLTKACSDAQPKAGLLIANTFPTLIKDPETNYRKYLWNAASTGCTELVEFFLSQVDDIQQYLHEHFDLLLAAADSGSVATVNYLLDLGTPIDAVNINNVSALHLATHRNHLPVVRLLVERGADMTLTTIGRTALDIAKSKEDKSIAMYLMSAQYERGRKRKAVASPVVEDVTQPPSQRPRR